MHKCKNSIVYHVAPPVFPDLDVFERAYITSALWASTDNRDETGGEPLDANFDIIDLPIETVRRLKSDCAEFREMDGVQNLLDQAYEHWRCELPSAKADGF